MSLAIIHWLLLGVLVLPVLVAQSAEKSAVVATAAEGPGDLLNAGEAAFNTGRWPDAVNSFQRFLADYGGLADTGPAVAKVKPLLGICYVRMNDFETAIPLLEEGLKAADLKPNQKTDLLFFTAVAYLRTGKAEAARQQLGAIFGDAKVERGRRMEALILGGASYVIEKNWTGAISFFQKHGDEIRSHQAEAGARADILLLHALAEEKRWDEADILARKISENSKSIRQWVTFASQLIGLGDHFLEAEQPHRAIVLLRKVPSKKEIELYQNDRLLESETELKFSTQDGNVIRSAQLQTTIDEIRRELDAFAKIPQFDSAARFRLAGAYFQLKRTREGCLILDQMVRQMEPDEVVESATASLIRGWMSLERYARASRTADLYLERFANFPTVPHLPEVMFLKAQALEGKMAHAEAADGYSEVAEKFRDHEIAPRARFMAAYNLLQLEKYAESGSLLAAQLKDLKPQDEMWQHVSFWRAMTSYFDQHWDDCRNELHAYLKAAEGEKTGQEYVDDAQFRIGYSYFSEARYVEAIRILSGFTEQYSTSEWSAEALLTLGDCHAAEGDLEAAESAYQKIAIEAPGFHDEGWMKRGNLMKAKKDLGGMKTVFSEFLKQRPDSPRTAEALQWLGWVAKQEGRLDEAREIYWDAISRMGNEPTRPGIEDIFLALQTLYTGPDRLELEVKLRDALEKSRGAKTNHLSIRLGWSLAQLHLSKKTEVEVLEIRQQRAREELVALVPELQAKETAPRILADVGDALAESGGSEKAKLIYEELRKWWPRAPERDRSYAGLGFIAIKDKDELTALNYFDRYEKSSVMPKTAPDETGISLVESELGGRVALARATLLENREPERAIAILLAIQKSKAMTARLRAEAFLQTGRSYVKREKNREALPYFEQVYLLFNRFPELVADAYLERGEVLEKMGLKDKAREVYSELVLREDLSKFETYKKCQKRVAELGGVLIPKTPEGSVILANPLPR